MRQHLEHRIEQHVRQGMALHEARRTAERAFGRADQHKEELRDLRDPFGWESLLRDISFSLRSLRRSPLVSLGVIITVALCLGANAIAFSALYGLVLKPLPFARSGELVEVYNTEPPPGRSKVKTSIGQYLEFKQHADLFENFALTSEGSDTLGGEESDPIRVGNLWTTDDYFDLLEVQPLLGRFYIYPDPGRIPSQRNVVVLTQSLWENRYHADPHVIGRIIALTGVPCEVIGVAPRAVESLIQTAQLFRPIGWTPSAAAPLAHRIENQITVYARIRPGIAREDALRQLNALERQFYATDAPPQMRDYVARNPTAVTLATIRTEQSKSIRPGLALLQGSAVVVLLLGCLNIAGLMLARLDARRTELAIRRALGAGIGTLIRQLLIENILLVGCGTILSLVIAWGGLRLINRSTSLILPQAPPISPDGVVLAATFLASLTVVCFAVLLPAILLYRSHRESPIQGGAPDSLPGNGVFRLNRLLVTGHVALTLLLLTGTGLLARDFTRADARNAGLDATHLIHARIAFNQEGQDAASNHTTADEIIQRFRAIPGVAAAGVASVFPTNGVANPASMILVQGATLGPQEKAPTALTIGVSPDFFSTMGLQIVEGRNFTAADNLPGARLAVVIDRDFAEKYFPGRSAVGQFASVPYPGRKPEEIPIVIGVVEPTRLQGPNDLRGLPFVFIPISQVQFGGFSTVIRTSRSLPELEPLLRNALRAVDPTLPLYNLKTVHALFDEGLDYQRSVTMFFGTLGLISLLLAAVGLSVGFACEASGRIGEIGIRRSLGASQHQIVASLFRPVFQKVALGLLLGLAALLCARRWLGEPFFTPSSADLVICLLAATLLVIVILAVIYLPAQRASQIDPVAALRHK